MSQFVSRAEMDAVSPELYQVIAPQYRDTLPSDLNASAQNAEIFRATLNFVPTTCDDLFKEVKYVPGSEWPIWKLVATFYLVETRIGPNTVRKAGERIYSTMPWPPQVQSIEDALRFVETAYFESHLRAPKERAGGWSVEAERPGVMTLADATPYPCMVNEGVIAGICVAFSKQKPAYRILAQPKRDGGLVTRYEVSYRPV